MADLFLKYQSLLVKQHAVFDGLQLLEQVDADLANDSTHFAFSANLALFSHIALVPLNAVVSMFQLGKAQSAYQAAVRAIYNKYAKSGANTEDSIAKSFLESLSVLMIEELKKKGLSDQVPGVNILVGLALDSLALVDVYQKTVKDANEISTHMRRVRNRIAEAKSVLKKIGIQRNEVLEQARKWSNTA